MLCTFSNIFLILKFNDFVITGNITFSKDALQEETIQIFDTEEKFNLVLIAKI